MKLASIVFRSVLVLFLAPLAGCSFDLGWGQSTLGDSGALSFSYTDFDDCLLGCAVDQPLLVGTRETLDIAGDALADRFEIESSNPAVLSATMVESACCGDGDCISPLSKDCKGPVHYTYTATVEAVGSGSVELRVRRANGDLVDTLPIKIEKASSLDLACSEEDDGAETPVSSITLRTLCTFHVTARDQSGTALRATEGFTITTDDPKVAVVNGDALLAPVDFNRVDMATVKTGSLEAKGTGQTTLVVEAAGASVNVPVTVP